MNEDTIFLAAKGCYDPINDDDEKQSMAWVIEALVLPQDKDYTIGKLRDYIRIALKKIEKEKWMRRNEQRI
jgi:hypothetical protein